MARNLEAKARLKKYSPKFLNSGTLGDLKTSVEKEFYDISNVFQGLEDTFVNSGVSSVNGETGDIIVTAESIGAISNNVTPIETINGLSGTNISLTAESVGAIPDSITPVETVNGLVGPDIDFRSDKVNMYLNVATSIPATAGWIRIPLKGVSFDTNSLADTTNGHVVIAKSGYYIVDCRVRSGTRGIISSIAIGGNGATLQAVGGDINHASYPVQYAQGGGAIIPFSAGTTVSLWMYATGTSGSLTTGAFDTWLSLIGPIL